MQRADTAAATLPGTPPSASVRRRLLEHVRLPLHRDAYALALNSAFTAATGLLYWIVAAKAYSAHAVGLNSALISAMMFLAGVASLNLPNILVRFLPESGDRILARVVWAYAISAAVAACAAVVFIVGVGSWTPRLGFLRSDRGLQTWFVFSTIAWCVFAIQDSVLTALGRAVWVPVENAVFSFVKLGLLAAAAAALPRYGIFVSWTIAMLVSVAGVNFLIFTRLMRRPDLRRPGAALGLRSRAFARYFAADYACSVAWISTANLMPVIVTAAAGATTNAYWALAYAVALPLYSVSTNIGTSLMLHGTARQSALPQLVRKAAIQGGWLLVPSVAVVVLLAPYLLSLFGASYADRSTAVLRLLAIGVLPNFVIILSVSIARVRRRLGRAVVALGTEAVIALGLATPLLHAMGVTGVGVGWACAQCVVALGLLLTWRNSFRADASSDTTAGSSPPRAPETSAAGEHQGARRLGRSTVHPLLGALFEGLERRRLRWMLLRVPSNLAAPTGDVDLLVAPADAEALREVAGELGFVALPGWESAPDLILMRYDRASDRWLLLDVSTSVSFRSPRSWELLGATDQVLRRRQLMGGIPVPADADAFWLLLLHCLLDKHRVADHHRIRLRRLAAVAPDSPLAVSLWSAAGPTFTVERFVDAAEAEGDEPLTKLGVRLAAALRRRRPIRDRLRALARDMARALRKPLLLRRRKGVSLALLGPNGVGKSTAAAGLQRSLPFDLRIVYLGLWKASMKPRGRIATGIEIATRPLRIWARYLSAQYHQFRGRVVLFDRYVYEAHLPASPPLLTVKRIYFLFLAHAVPGPRATVVLDVPGNVAYERKQENPPEELEAERRLYRELTTRVPSMEFIDAGADADTVRAEITTIVWRELALRWQGAVAPS
jgi:O-antigen/teichoic acid export membrane protein